MPDIFAVTVQVLREITLNAVDPKNEGSCRYCQQKSYEHLDWCPMEVIGKFVETNIGPISEIIDTHLGNNDG